MSEAADPSGDLVAAVDLGSNSFHMVIARQTGHDLQMLDRIREPVRLAAGLRPDGGLEEDAQRRAIDCLERFGQRLRELDPGRVRAVGTNALRRARRAPGFRQAARRALGHEIEVVSGMEEARLIYLGVAHTTPAIDEERLVVDIGGGSTEIIRGRGFEPSFAASRFLGSVSYTQRFFAGGVDRERFRAAQTAASQELQDLRPRLGAVHFDRVLGASGTVLAVSAILRSQGITDGRIDYPGMKRLRRIVVDDPGGASWFDAESLRADRLGVLPAGLSILMAIHRTLSLEEMHPSQGALREGVLYDQVGRVGREEVRARTIDRMAERFAVDAEQARRVHDSAIALFEQAPAEWALDGALARRVLLWASRLHEAGLSLAHAGYHRHGAYLVANSDMPGFSVDDQALLAAVIRTHRRKIRREYFEAVAAQHTEEAMHLAVLFRIAVLLNRGRTDPPRPELAARGGRKLHLGFEDGWLARHPLTLADLEEEAAHLRAIDRRLSFGPRP